MSPDSMVKARLSLVAGKHTQPPNLVLVPAGAKSFPVAVEWSMETEESYVIGSHDPADAHVWCVLDAGFKQVMRGAVKRRGGPKKAEPMISRTLHGGGAPNPRRESFELEAGKLKNGAAYTLVASRHGMVAAFDFVAVHEPKPKAATRKKAKKAKKKTVRKVKAAAWKVAAKARAKPRAKKATARKKPAA